MKNEVKPTTQKETYMSKVNNWKQIMEEVISTDHTKKYLANVFTSEPFLDNKSRRLNSPMIDCLISNLNYITTADQMYDTFITVEKEERETLHKLFPTIPDVVNEHVDRYIREVICSTYTLDFKILIENFRKDMTSQDIAGNTFSKLSEFVKSNQTDIFIKRLRYERRAKI